MTFKEIWENDFLERISDIRVKVQGKEYKLHKMIFISSDYMKNTIIRGCETDIIEMIDIGRETWEIILRYLYSKIIYSSITEDRYKKFTWDDIDIEQMIELYYLADQMLLKILCEEIINVLPKYIKTAIKNEKYIQLEDILEILPHETVKIEKGYFSSIDYIVSQKEWRYIDWIELSRYPRSLYYILTYISSLDYDDTQLFQGRGSDIRDIAKSFGIDSRWNGKTEPYRHKEYLMGCIIKILMASIMKDLGDSLKIIYNFEWRIKNDELLYSMLKSHFMLYAQL